MNPPMVVSKQYTTLLHKAACLARQSGASLLERKHLFWAMREMSPKIFQRLLGGRKCLYVEGLPVAEGKDIENEGKEIAFSSEAYRVLSLHGGVLGDVMETVGESSVGIPHVAAALLLDPDPQGPVLDLFRLNGIEPSERKAEILRAARKLGGGRSKDEEKKVLKNVGFVRNALHTKLVGQEETIEKLATGLWQFWTRPPEERTRPLSIFIGGPAGSGKTLCSETFMTAIAQLTGKPKIDILNAGMYSSRDSSRDVVGLNASWKGGPLAGKCTYPIYENPYGVVCLKHIEALHPIALSHLLSAITTGHLKDESLDKTVDFKNAIFLFVSSAGWEGLANTSTSEKALPMTNSRLAEVLCHNIPDDLNAKRNLQALIEQCTLCVTMNPLDVEGISTLTHRTVVGEFGKFKRSNCKIHMDADAVADILVQSISSLDARAIPAMVGEVVEPLRKMLLNQPDTWCKMKALEVVVKGAAPLNVADVRKNLHMRKRLTFDTTLDCSGRNATLTIEAKGQSLLPAVADGIIRVEPPRDSDSFDKLVGIDVPLSHVRRVARYFSGQTQIKPESLLLYGPPGCGKTSFVRAIAADLKKPFVLLRCSDLDSPESLLHVFATIRKYAKDGLIVFLDELDSIAGSREGKSEAYIERLNLLLQQIDGFDADRSAKIFYISATNRLGALDDAIMRSGRFGQTIVFAPLQKSERRALVRIALEECQMEMDAKLADFMAETTEGLAPATIKAIIREMALGIDDSRKATKQDFLRARQVVTAGMHTQQPALDERDTLAVATHEAGHALCCLRKGKPFVQASIVSCGRSLGFLEQKDDGKFAHTKSDLLAYIDISLAGRVAEEIMFGQATDGANNDIEQATKWGRHYVRSGFSEYGLGIPPDEMEWSEISPIIRNLLSDRYARLKQQLSKEKALLRRLAALLMKKKVVCEDELREYCTKKASRRSSHE